MSTYRPGNNNVPQEPYAVPVPVNEIGLNPYSYNVPADRAQKQRTTQQYAAEQDANYRIYPNWPTEPQIDQGASWVQSQRQPQQQEQQPQQQQQQQQPQLQEQEPKLQQQSQDQQQQHPQLSQPNAFLLINEHRQQWTQTPIQQQQQRQQPNNERQQGGATCVKSEDTLYQNSQETLFSSSQDSLSSQGTLSSNSQEKQWQIPQKAICSIPQEAPCPNSQMAQCQKTQKKLCPSSQAEALCPNSEGKQCETMEKLRLLYDSIIRDKYGVGIIQSTLDGKTAFNKTAFDLLFGAKTPKCQPQIQPPSLLEAFSLRISLERENFFNEPIDTSIKDYFMKQQDTELNQGIAALFNAEKIAMEQKSAQLTFEANIKKVNVTLERGSTSNYDPIIIHNFTAATKLWEKVEDK